MQLKLYVRRKIILYAFVLSLVLAISWIITRWHTIAVNGRIFYLVWVSLLTALFMILFRRYEKCETSIYMKACLHQEIALAKIISGKPYKKILDFSFKDYMIYEIDLIIYDNSLNEYKATIYDKMSSLQRIVDKGHVYVSFDPNKLEDSLIIPNCFLFMYFSKLSHIIMDYEDKVADIEYLEVVLSTAIYLRRYQNLEDRKSLIPISMRFK